jgi:excisionase family DNA binding protein
MRAPKNLSRSANSTRPQSHVTRHTPYEDLPQFLSVEEFRTFVGLGRSTVYDLLRRGELPCAKFGRALRISKNALRPYMEVKDEQKS